MDSHTLRTKHRGLVLVGLLVALLTVLGVEPSRAVAIDDAAGVGSGVDSSAVDRGDVDRSAVARAHSVAWTLPLTTPAASTRGSPSPVLRAFDPPQRPWTAGHRGVDLATTTDDAVILAPADATVRFSGAVAGRPVVGLDHGDGVLSAMEPVFGEVRVGDKVTAGQPIGRLDPGTAHCAVPCVHLGVRVQDAWVIGSSSHDRYVDPAVLLGLSGPSVLWPLEQDP